MFKGVTTHLLDGVGGNGTDIKSRHELRLTLPDMSDDADLQIARVVQLTNHLSLPFCQLRIRLIFRTDEMDRRSLVEDLFMAIDSAQDTRAWMDLVRVLDDDVARVVSLLRLGRPQLTTQICSFAEDSLLGSIPSRVDEMTTRKYLSIIQTTARSLEAFAPTTAIPSLATKLEALVQSMVARPTHNSNASMDVDSLASPGQDAIAIRFVMGSPFDRSAVN